MVNTEGIWMVDGVGMSAWALGHQHPQRLAFVARPKDKVPGAACERFTGSLLLTVSKMELTELNSLETSAPFADLQVFFLHLGRAVTAGIAGNYPAIPATLATPDEEGTVAEEERSHPTKVSGHPLQDQCRCAANDLALA